MKILPDISQITAFMIVSEELSFKRAAERLAVDPSAISRRIKELESTLGFALFYRSTHNVRLTDAGRRFYDGSLDVVGTLRDTVATASRVAKGNVGHIRIAYMTFAGLSILPTALAEYRKLFPELAVSLSYQPTQDQRISLARGEIDVGLMLGPFKHTEFDVLSVARECLFVAVPEQHPLAREREVSVSDFSDSPLVMGTDRQWDFYRSRVGQSLSLNDLESRIEYEAPDMMGMLGLVKSGLGITIVPQAMTDYCPRGVVMRRITGSEGAIETIASWRKPVEAKVRDFANILKKISNQPKQNGAPNNS